MRSTLALGLTFLVLAPAAAAEAPIPQDAAKMEARQRERLEWQRRSLAGAYETVGKRDPRWDEPARKALDLAARRFARQIDPVVTTGEVHAQARKAVDAGCDDPMILYLYARSSVGANYPSAGEYVRRFRAAEAAMSAGGYSPYRKAVAVLLSTELTAWKNDPTPDDRREAERGFDAVLDLLPRSVAEDDRNRDWEEGWFSTVNSVIGGFRHLGGDYKAAYDRVDARLAGVPKVESLRLALRGHFHVHWAAEARTAAPAALVTPGQFRTYEERMREARDALNKAWMSNPDQPNVANLMMAVEKGIGGGDRGAMETWFERAMAADGNDREACWQKLDWLDPKWYGGDTGEEMLAFGKACRATKNWRTGITLLAADAHLRYALLIEPAGRAKYLGSPAVWPEVRSVYDEYLAHYPEDAAERSKYAALCYEAGQYSQAHAQFLILGDRLTAWQVYPNYPLESLKTMRDEARRGVAGQGPAGWVQFTVRNNEGAWSVNLPGRPERRQERGLLGVKVRYIFTRAADGVTYAVRVQTVPPDVKAGGAKAFLDAARDANAEGHGGRVLDDHPAALGGHPGHEYRIDAPSLRPAVLRVRSAVIGERHYELSVSASESDVSGPSAVEFLDSFQFNQ